MEFCQKLRVVHIWSGHDLNLGTSKLLEMLNNVLMCLMAEEFLGETFGLSYSFQTEFCSQSCSDPDIFTLFWPLEVGDQNLMALIHKWVEAWNKTTFIVSCSNMHIFASWNVNQVKQSLGHTLEPWYNAVFWVHVVVQSCKWNSVVTCK